MDDKVLLEKLLKMESRLIDAEKKLKELERKIDDVDSVASQFRRIGGVVR